MALKVENLMESIKFTNFLFNNISSYVFLVDKDAKVVEVNNSFKSLFSVEEQEALNNYCGNVIGCAFAVEEDKVCGTTSNCHKCPLRSCIVDGFKDHEQTQNSYVSRVFYINGQPLKKHFQIKVKCIKYNGEDIDLIMVDDVTEIEEQKEQIKTLAETDFLTKLYNRRYFMEVGEKLFENAKRENLSIAVAMLDIDFFKKINDTHGHDAGDFILTNVARVLMENTRAADVVARFGGEEFCILLTSVDGDAAYNVIEKLRETIEQSGFEYKKQVIPVTISCGVSTELVDSLEDMINSADKGLYRAKEGGRNRTILV